MSLATLKSKKKMTSLFFFEDLTQDSPFRFISSITLSNDSLMLSSSPIIKSDSLLSSTIIWILDIKICLTYSWLKVVVMFRRMSIKRLEAKSTLKLFNSSSFCRCLFFVLNYERIFIKFFLLKLSFWSIHIMNVQLSLNQSIIHKILIIIIIVQMWIKFKR